jgi:hypothetical protein
VPGLPSPSLIYDPQDLEPSLVARLDAGDVEGMVALFEPDAVIDCGDGRLVRGEEAIRNFYADLVARGMRFAVCPQRPALICDDLALTSVQSSNGSVTAEVARRQNDGSWRWVIDCYSIT